MTDTWAEQEARRLLGDCTCAEQYRRIRETVNPARTDPNCLWCNYGKDIAAALRRAEDRGLERAAKEVAIYWSGPRYAAAIRSLKSSAE